MINRQLTTKQKAISIFRPQLYMRPTIAKVKELYKKKKVTGVEIGVASGINAYNILRVLNIEKLYLIDPYNCANEKSFIIAKRLLQPYKKRIIFVKERSHIIANQIPNDLDFVYIDGDHSYKGIQNDFYSYYPKIKTGGVIGGHDFCFHSMDVIRFVLDLRKQFGYGIDVKENDWWIVKGENNVGDKK